MIEKVNDYPNYSVDHLGVVFNNKTGRELKQSTKKGYRMVYLYNQNGRKSFLVHRLVARAFIPNVQNLPQVNHKDENPSNNNVDNLEWCTASYNCNYGAHNNKIKEHMLRNNHFRGKKHTLLSIEKMSTAKKGKPSKRKRKIIIDGIEYDSVLCAMQTLKISTRKLYKLLKQENQYVREV